MEITTHRSTRLSIVPSPSRGIKVNLTSSISTPASSKNRRTAAAIILANFWLVPVGSPITLWVLAAEYVNADDSRSRRTGAELEWVLAEAVRTFAELQLWHAEDRQTKQRVMVHPCLQDALRKNSPSSSHTWRNGLPKLLMENRVFFVWVQEGPVIVRYFH